MVVKKLTVEEYMPKKLTAAYRLICICLIGLSCLAIGVFFRKLERLHDKKEACAVYEQRMDFYQELMQKAGESYGAGDYETCEALYLQAAAMLPKDETAYLRLAEIYRNYREYELAAEILETYPKELDSGRIKKEYQELLTLQAELEQSIFTAEQ